MGLQQVSLSDVIPLRHRVLRAGQALETCYFEGDEAPVTKHYAWIEDGLICSIATVMYSPKLLDDEMTSFQLRGVATEPEMAGSGLGSKFLQSLHQEIGASWWCNARAVAVSFYKRNGLVVVGSPFDIPGIGLHYVMKYKKTAGS